MVTNQMTKQILGDTIGMETGIVSRYFATSSIVDFNSSETTTNQTNSEDIPKWTNAEIARLIQIIIRPILLIIGSVGNGLTVYIMRMTSLKKMSCCFYMFLLALADTCK